MTRSRFGALSKAFMFCAAGKRCPRSLLITLRSSSAVGAYISKEPNQRTAAGSSKRMGRHGIEKCSHCRQIKQRVISNDTDSDGAVRETIRGPAMQDLCEEK